MLGDEPSRTQRACSIDRKQRVAGAVHDLQEVSFQCFRSWKFSETYFGRNFPGGCCRDENHIRLICDDR